MLIEFANILFGVLGFDPQEHVSLENQGVTLDQATRISERIRHSFGLTITPNLILRSTPHRLDDLV